MTDDDYLAFLAWKSEFFPSVERPAPLPAPPQAYLIRHGEATDERIHQMRRRIAAGEPVHLVASDMPDVLKACK